MTRTPEIIYVAPDGDDRWSGHLNIRSAAGDDGPLATLEAARTTVRRLATTAGRTSSIRVYLCAGTYARLEPFVLGPEDSGTAEAPVIWSADAGAEVRLTGSRPVNRPVDLPVDLPVDTWHLVSDSATLARLAPAARGHVVEIDLAAAGVPPLADIAPRGTPDVELFCGGQRLARSRWPRNGWLRITDVPQSGPTRMNEGLEREKRFDGVPVGRHYGYVTYDGERPRAWADSGDLYTNGYWTWDWSDSFQRVDRLDAERREIHFAEPHHHYGYTRNQRFYFLNILEEILQPGDWCLDRARGVIFLWPLADRLDVHISHIDGALVELRDCCHVHLENLHVEYGRCGGVLITGGQGNRVRNCTLRLLGGDAIVIDGGTDHGVEACEITEVGLQGIHLRGGDRRTLSPSGHFAINNHIHRFSRWVRTYQWAINLDGVGHHVAHNLIHDAPHEALYLRGNDHVIEFNEIHDVVQETGDSGALHTGRDVTWRGNIIRHNYIHHLQGAGLHGVVAIYLDDFACGFTVYGNLCWKAGRGTLIGGGRDNVVENNLYVDCCPAVHLDARGLSWAAYYYDGTYDVLRELLAEVDGLQPPYADRYPLLLSYYDGEPAVPKNNHFVRNVSYGGRWMDLYDFFAYDLSVVTVADNVIGDDVLYRHLAEPPVDDLEPYYLDIDRLEGYVMARREDSGALFPDNLVVDGDPGFVDLAGGDLRLRPDALALQRGFQPLPLERMGLLPGPPPGAPARS